MNTATRYHALRGHVPMIAEVDRAPRFAATCSCGWQHDSRHVKATAEADARAHLDNVLRLFEGLHRSRCAACGFAVDTPNHNLGCVAK